MRAAYDLAIVGSGFAGSLLAMVARRLNLSVVLLERGRHPRFAIGESSTPLANLLLEQIADRYNLPALASLSKWGTWQRDYPHLTCGLKRGFSFFHHRQGERLAINESRTNQLLVAASPHDRIADVHWFRSDFDHFLVRQAQAESVDFFDEVELETATESMDGVTLRGTRNGKAVEFCAKFVVDATGPRGFLHKALTLPESEFPSFPQTKALYTHFTGVAPLTDSLDLGDERPPFPVDEAALHHVFDGGWIWVLRFNNGVTSAGVAAVNSQPDRLRFHDGAPAWKRLLQEMPTVRAQFEGATPVRPFLHSEKMTFRSGCIAGTRWALMPSAAGFVDPLLSTGFPLTLLGIQRLANVLEAPFGSEASLCRLKQYERQTNDELLAAARLIGALYTNMDCFRQFSSLSLLYFAAASYTETALRLDKTDLAGSFLLHDHVTFGSASEKILKRATDRRYSRDRERLHDEVMEAIEPIDVAGLRRQERRHWYPVDAEDLLASARKVNSTPEGIKSLLDRSGFWV